MSVTLRHKGLPNGFGRSDLLALLRQVGRLSLNLSAREQRYLEISIECCWPQDFEENSICAHWKRVDTLANELGCSARQVNNIERALEQKKLIARTIGADGHRRGERQDSVIIRAAGINLAPLLSREKMQELLHHKQCLILKERALAVLKADIQIVRRRIRASQNQALIAHADAILPSGRTSRLTDCDKLEDILRALQAVERVITEDIGVTEISDAAPGVSDASEIYDTPYIQKKTSNIIGRGQPSHPTSPVPARQALLLASPAYQRRVEELGIATPANLIEASSLTCGELGISQRTWGVMCQQMGRDAAALAVLVIDRNARLPSDNGYQVRNPAGCAAAISRRWRGKGVNLLGLLMAGRAMEVGEGLPEGLDLRRDGDDKGQLRTLMAGILNQAGERLAVEGQP